VSYGVVVGKVLVGKMVLEATMAAEMVDYR
jgi:hypothetical protein